MRKIICLTLIILLLIGSTAFGFAAEQQPMVFTGPSVELSLQGAKDRMLSEGAPIAMADVNRRMDNAMTRANFEGYAIVMTPIWRDDGREALPRRLAVQREIAEFALAFSREQTPRNYDAEVNQIIRDVVHQYYQLAHARENLRISRDNMAIQQTLYENTQRMFDLGLRSRQDVLTAEFGLNEARVSVEESENALNNARMGFNIAFGFDLMQNVTLTDSLNVASLPDTSLQEAIGMALENRNEMHVANFRFELTEMEMRDAARGSRFSAAHIQAEANLMRAITDKTNAPKRIEMDIRTKYMNMHHRKNEVELGRLNVSNAQEAYRLANLQFNAGMITLVETQQAQLMAFTAELRYYAALLEYNLAIIDFELATTVGTSSFRIQPQR